MKFKTGDKFIVKETKYTGTILTAAGSYYNVKWDHGGIGYYRLEECDNIWNFIDLSIFNELGD